MTGAARGIDRATAVALAGEGAAIVGIDICAVVSTASGVKRASDADLNETGKLVRESGSRWMHLS